jgi:hypothetical protein
MRPIGNGIRSTDRKFKSMTTVIVPTIVVVEINQTCIEEENQP